MSFLDNLKENKKAMSSLMQTMNTSTLGSGVKPMKQLHNSTFRSNKFSVTDINYQASQVTLRSTLSQNRTVASPNKLRRASIVADYGKRINPKEYFQKYIRTQNKDFLQRQQRAAKDSDNFIVYDRQNKLNFQEKVSEYMRGIELAEKEQLNPPEIIPEVGP